jgi:nicotinamide phosphoribosyltransferase
MGGGLLQKVNRDTQRFAFKCSAVQSRDGKWHDVFKQPLDSSKKSKSGRLKLVNDCTVRESDPGVNQLVTVFEDGELLVDHTFKDIRERAAL